MELEPQVEEQEDESQRGEHLQVVRVREKGVSGRVRAEEDPGQDEQGDRRQPDTAAEAGEDGSGEEGAAHGEEGVCVSDEPDPSGSGQVRVKGASRIHQ